MALSRGSKVFLVFIALVVAGILGALAWANQQMSAPPAEPGLPVTIEVERGTSVAELAEELVANSVVSNGLTFRISARSRGLGSSLLAGIYDDFETGMSNDAAIDVLLAGPPVAPSSSFTVPEGLDVELTLEALAKQFSDFRVGDFAQVLDERIAAAGDDSDGGESEDGVSDGGESEDGASDGRASEAGGGALVVPEWVPPLDEFGEAVRSPFEGLLWPQTYAVAQDADPRQVLQPMLDQLAEEMAAIPPDQIEAAAARGMDRYEMLILASLIERETRVDEERGLVSAVIANRLEADQPLQIDATVLYAMGEHDDQLVLDDLEIDSPYNTYEVGGLPPTPISGLGRASLQAAFNPDQVPFRYYVLSPECDGSHNFAATLEEHNANVAAFRDAGRCQP